MNKYKENPYKTTRESVAYYSNALVDVLESTPDDSLYHQEQIRVIRSIASAILEVTQREVDFYEA